MRRLYIIVFGFTLFFLPLAAQAQEKIGSFDVVAKINADASVDFKETIGYDFGTEQRHGIFRDIPVSYQTQSGVYNLEVGNIGVNNPSGRPYLFSTSYEGNDLRIKIGDPNRTVSGKQTYVISYTANQAINYFPDHDELYWNVTGNGWAVDINQTSARVELSKEFPKDEIKVLCFKGELGSQAACDKAEVIVSPSGAALAAAFSQSNLGPGQNLTMVIWLPKGAVAENKTQGNKNAQRPVQRETPSNFIRQSPYAKWFLLLPVLVLFYMVNLWQKRGRDPKGFETVVAQYDPPDGLTPTEVGTIVDEKADNQDISSDIINLAVKGYLKITRIENKVLFFTNTDYQLDLLKDAKDLENPFEVKLIESLFNGGNSVKLSDLKNKFYRDLPGIKDAVYKSTVDKGYFVKNPQSTRRNYLLLGAAFIPLAILFLSSLRQAYLAAGTLLSGIIVAAFGFFMPAKTVKGAQAKQHILGLKNYLSVAEKDRLAFHNAPEKNPERFEKLLPYAMALGVDAAWAKQFEGIYNQPPSWYNDPSGRMFNSVLLASSLHSFSQTANAAFASPSSSGAAGGHSGFGGGGFSGGGFGGGGGGSW